MPDQKAYIDARKDNFVAIIEILRQDFEKLTQDAPKREDFNKLELDEVVEHIVYQQGYALLINVTSHLWQGADFQEILPQITKRYNKEISLMDTNLQSDLKQSSKAKKDGTISACEDLLKVLKIIERDFDLNYTGPDQKTIEQLAKQRQKAPENIAQEIKTLYKKHTMAMAKELTLFINDLNDEYVSQTENKKRAPSSIKRNGPKR